jgi:hypothetical protein
VINRGSCGGSSDWKLKLSPEDNGVEVQFEVDTNRSGRTWTVKIFRNGDRIFRGRRMTGGASGSFTVRRVTDDTSGTDRFGRGP